MTGSDGATTDATTQVEELRPQRSAGSLAWGLVLMTVGGAIAGIEPASVANVVGLAILVLGGLRLAVGVHRAASNLDLMAKAAHDASRRDGA